MVNTSMFKYECLTPLYIGEKNLFYSLCYFTVHPDVLFCGNSAMLQSNVPILIGSLLDFLSRLSRSVFVLPYKMNSKIKMLAVTCRAKLI